MIVSTELIISKRIIRSSGEISKDKINLIAGAITQLFAEVVRVTGERYSRLLKCLTGLGACNFLKESRL